MSNIETTETVHMPLMNETASDFTAETAHDTSPINAGADPHRFAPTIAREVPIANFELGERVLHATCEGGGICSVREMGPLVSEPEQRSLTQEEMLGLPPSVSSEHQDVERV